MGKEKTIKDEKVTVGSCLSAMTCYIFNSGGVWKHIKHSEFYMRYEDMSPDGGLQVLIQEDGDVIIQIIPESKSHKPRSQLSFVHTLEADNHKEFIRHC